jgi:hypothetical protein
MRDCTSRRAGGCIRSKGHPGWSTAAVIHEDHMLPREEVEEGRGDLKGRSAFGERRQWSDAVVLQRGVERLRHQNAEAMPN